MVQFYRDIWERRSNTLDPLTDLVGAGKKKLKWTEFSSKELWRHKESHG